jgi:hypothetical protein
MACKLSGKNLFLFWDITHDQNLYRHTTHSWLQNNLLLLLILGKQNFYMMLLRYMRAPLELTIGGLDSQTWVGITIECLLSSRVAVSKIREFDS